MFQVYSYYFSGYLTERHVNIYVGNLSPRTSEPQLREAFARFGAVGKISIHEQPADSATYRFCFVEMPGDNQASVAISALNGDKIDGCALTVKESGVTV
ncbi:MAG: RNA-binding protein [Candidatus Abyssobacteria bacterium SURF_17]|uniref:RNA-binding protein n=1 Tax=Candidatus Abyssobacteria bacterium SURF_17 TaxID=2093361 RepID=A0A419EYV7_9BACT|nr:MAG: RNA-binding protein [Candidatus Abyssubacteria bacterium SURF_17]